jgi:hypothetical protein
MACIPAEKALLIRLEFIKPIQIYCSWSDVTIICRILIAPFSPTTWLYSMRECNVVKKTNVIPVENSTDTFLFTVLTKVLLKISIFFGMALCILVKVNRLFRRTYRPPSSESTSKARRNQHQDAASSALVAKDRNLHSHCCGDVISNTVSLSREFKKLNCSV